MKLYKICNKISLLLHVLASAAGYFVMEAICRHSFIEAWNYMTQRPLVFAYKCGIHFYLVTNCLSVSQESVLENPCDIVLADTGHYQWCSPAQPCYTRLQDRICI